MSAPGLQCILGSMELFIGYRLYEIVKKDEIIEKPILCT